MMLSAALIFLAAQADEAPAPAPAPVDEVVANEIVVIGKQLDVWRGRVKSRNGDLVCDVTKSTGDADIDQIGCAAMIGCTAEIAPDLNAIAAKDLPRKERKRQMTALLEAQGDCVLDRRDAGIDALARKRAGA